MERLDRMFMEAAAARASEEAGPSRAAPVVREAAEGDPVGGGGTVASQILKRMLSIKGRQVVGHAHL